MIECQEAYELLLEAEPAELRGEGDLPLARHLASCAECAALAAGLRAQHEQLAQALTALTPAHPPRAVARRRRWPVFIAPLAAAALLLLVLRQQGSWPRPRPEWPSLDALEPDVPTSTVVNAIGAAGVVVLQTRDPNITVVWTF